jgi:hypothetical protein
MKIKIISQGTARTTRVINAETGEVIEGVTSAKWECSMENPVATATLTVNLAGIDVEGECRDNT